jgi:hypothetical protein
MNRDRLIGRGQRVLGRLTEPPAHRRAPAWSRSPTADQLWPIDRSRQYERNPRTRSEGQVDQIAGA